MKMKMVAGFAAVVAVGLACLSAEARPEKKKETVKETAKVTDQAASAKASKINIEKRILDNGLKVLVVEEHSHPIITIMVTVDAGLASEGEYSGTGISHFIEHAIFKGTVRRKSGAIEEEVKSYGGMINAATGLDSATYHITVPKEYAYQALDLMEDIIFNPLFNNEDVEKEKEVILKEIKLTNDDPPSRVMKGLWQTAYLAHPYKAPIIGHEALFKDLAKDDLVKYHSARYTPNNIILTIVGDIDKDEAFREIERLFKNHPRKRNTDVSAPVEPLQNTSRELKEHAPINLAYMVLGYHTVELSHPDVYALDVLGIILGDWDGSRLNKKLVKNTEVLYAISSFNYTPRYPGLFIIYGVGSSGNIEKAKEEILNEIKKIEKDGVKEEELEAAKAMVISNYIDSLETTGGLANAASQGEFLAGEASFFEKYVENIRNVNNEAIKKAAREYLTENNLSVSYLYPETHASSVDKPIPSAKKNTPQKITLTNGVRLLLKEDARLPKVSLVSAFLGGVRAETAENNGISNLTSAMLLKGTKTRKESAIKPFLESRGGEIAHFSGNNSFGLSMDFLTSDTKAALDLLEDVIKNPVFPEEELEKEKGKLYAAIKREDDDVYDVGFLKLRHALFGNHPYGLRAIGETASLMVLSRKDIADFYKQYGVAGNLVISVVGDFDAQKMHSEIARRFSSMNNTPFGLKARPVEPLTGVKQVEFYMPREQSLIVVGFRGARFMDEDRYCLDILSSIFSGENGRLYQTVRNELGLSYALGTVSTPGIDTGFVASYVATDKEHLEKTKEILLSGLENLKADAISEEELLLAKSSIIGSQKMSLQAFKALSFRMALDELYGIGYENYLVYPKVISGITLEDVVKAAKKYITTGNHVIATVEGY